MLRHLALDEEDALFQVDAHGQQQGVGLQHVLAQGGGLLAHGDGVEVRQAVDAFVIFLQADEILQGPQVVAQVKALEILLQAAPVAHRADVVAQGEGARGLDQAEDPFFLLCFHCDSLLTWSFPHRFGPAGGCLR